MAQTPFVARDELTLNADFTRDLGLTNQQTELSLPPAPLVMVARLVHLAGGTIRGHDVVIFADEVDEVGKPAGVPGLTLVTNKDEASENTTGKPSNSLTIWTRKLGTASAVSIGQKGGIGLKGRRATDLDCTPPPVADPLRRPEPIDPIPPIESIPGKQGAQGKDGAKGGPGGRVVVNSVEPPPAGAVAGFRGIGGGGGDKGPGGDGGFGCPPGTNQGPDGLKGGTLGPGADVAGVVNDVTVADFESALQGQVDRFPWAAVRYSAADVAARRGRHDVAALELEFADSMGAQSQADAAAVVRTRLRHNLTPLGFERDVDVTPALDAQTEFWHAAALSYRQAMTDDARRAIRFQDRSQLIESRPPMVSALDTLIVEGLKDLDALVEKRLVKLTEVRGDLANTLADVGNRINTLVVDQELPEGIFIQPNIQITARDLAAKIRAVLADETGQASAIRHLLAADLDLLTTDLENDTFPAVQSTTDAAGEPFAVPNSALRDIRQRATGLASVIAADPNPGPPGSDHLPVISFRAVREGLRQAHGNPRLLQALAELTELAHRTRVAQLREIQRAAGAKVREGLEDRMKTVRFSLNRPADVVSGPGQTTSLATSALALDWMEASQLFADFFSMRAHEAEQAVTLYTLDATFHGARWPESGSPSTAAGGRLHSPDVEQDIRQRVNHPGSELAEAARSLRDTHPEQAELLYGQRGTFIAGRGESPVDPLTFSSNDHPEVFIRLLSDNDAWFDATVDDLQPGRFEGKVVGLGVVFEGLTTTADDDPDEDPPITLDVFVEHSGISTQRRLDGVVVPQHLYAGRVRVPLQRQPASPDGVLSDEWIGEMRFDDPKDGTGVAGEPQNFPFWGRGAAAGWRITFENGGILNKDNLRLFELEVEYDCFAPLGAVSLLRIDAPLGALVPGRTVHATAVLTAPAPPGGLKIGLKSEDTAALSVPAAVVVPAGSDRVTIPVKVLAPSTGLLRLTATTPDGFSRRALVTVPTPAAGAPNGVTRLDIRAPGEEFAAVSGLAFDGDRLLATAGKVTIDTDGTIRPDGPGNLLSVKTGAGGMSGLQRFPIVKQPRAIDVANGKAYVVNNDPTVYSLGIIDLATNKPLAETHIGFGPTQVAVDAAANLVYVSNWGGKSLEVFHGTTGERVASIPGLRGPNGLAVDTVRRRVYVALNYFSGGPNDTENGLAVIQRAPTGNAHFLERIIPIAGRTLPMDVAYDSTRGLIHLVNIGVAGEQLPGVTTFQASDLTKLGFTPVPGPLFCCDVHLASGAVVCGGPAAGVHVVDGANRRLVSSQPVAHAVVSVAFHQPTGAIFAGDRQKGEIIRLAPVSVEQIAWR